METEQTPPSSLLDRSEDITLMVRKIQTFQAMLMKATKVIRSIDDADLKKEYALEMMPIVDEYKKIIKDAKDMFENHFKWEREENAPIKMKFRKAYKTILSEYKGTF